MKFLNDWGIPFFVFGIWAILILLIIPLIVRRLKKKAEQSQNWFHVVFLSALGLPLLLFLFGLGLSVLDDLLPPIPAKWEKYIAGFLFALFVSSGFLFLDRFMLRLLRRYSKTFDAIASTAGVIKVLYRAALLALAAFIILDRLKITITPFLASLGIGGIVVALALQDTLANFFSGIYIYFDKPVRIGDYVRLETGEEGYITHVGWHSTRIRILSNNMVIISNTKLAGSRITNFYLPETEIAVLINLCVAHESDLDKVEKITSEVANKVLKETKGGVKDFEPLVRYNGLDECGVKFTVILHCTEYADQYLIIHEFIKRIKRRYEEEGIKLPQIIKDVRIVKESSEKEQDDQEKDIGARQVI